MNDRTLVYITFLPDCIAFRTVNRKRKSPHCFYILRSRLTELERKPEILVSELNSFAVIRRDAYAGTIEIEFTWLSGDYSHIFGYKQTIILPYDKLSAFACKITSESYPVVWKTLSIDNSHKYPKLVFKSKKNLQNVIANGTIRRKLAHALRDEFKWPYAEKIEFYDDYMPYSFIFRKIRNGKLAITGGLVLHELEDAQKTHYSIHT